MKSIVMTSLCQGAGRILSPRALTPALKAAFTAALTAVLMGAPLVALACTQPVTPPPHTPPPHTPPDTPPIYWKIDADPADGLYRIGIEVTPFSTGGALESCACGLAIPGIPDTAYDVTAVDFQIWSPTQIRDVVGFGGFAENTIISDLLTGLDPGGARFTGFQADNLSFDTGGANQLGPDEVYKMVFSISSDIMPPDGTVRFGVGGAGTHPITTVTTAVAHVPLPGGGVLLLLGLAGIAALRRGSDGA